MVEGACALGLGGSGKTSAGRKAADTDSITSNEAARIVLLVVKDGSDSDPLGSFLARGHLTKFLVSFA